MTLVDVDRLYKRWKTDPPVAVLVAIIAQMLGWKPPEREVEQVSYEVAANENREWFSNPERWFPRGQAQ